MAAAICIGSIALVSTGESSAEPGGEYEPPTTLDPTLVAKDQVREVAEQMARQYRLPGFGYTAIDFDKKLVTLYFKGTPPLEAIRAQLPNADGVRVAIVPIVFSQTELDHKTQALIDAAPKLDGPPINTIGKRPDYSGLIAYVDADRLSAARELIPGYTNLAGVPVDVAEGGAYRPQTRRNDSAPWQGGGQLRLPGSNRFCTTGFAVLDNETGTGRLLSAGHCKTDPSTLTEVATRANDGAGELIAYDSGLERAARYDGLLIDPVASPASIGKVFAGPWDALTTHARYQLHVGGSAPPSLNDTVCVSGANSGEHGWSNGDCQKTISDLSRAFPCVDSPAWCHGFVYGGPNLTSTGGDSGAPVYIMRADGRVGARGIHSGGLNSVACPTDTAGYEGGDCSSLAIAVPINDLEDRYTVHVEFD